MSRPYICRRCRSSQVLQIRKYPHQWMRLSSTSAQAPREVPSHGTPNTTRTSTRETSSSRLGIDSLKQPDGAFIRQVKATHNLLTRSSQHGASPARTYFDDNALRDLTDRTKSQSEVWQGLASSHYFNSSTLPESLEISFRQSPVLRSLYRKLIKASVRGDDPGLPPFEEVAEKFWDRNLFRYTLLHDVTRLAVQKLLDIMFKPNDIYDYQRLLEKVMWTWRHVTTELPQQVSLGREAQGWVENLAVQMHRTPTGPYMDRFRGTMNSTVTRSLEQPLATDSALLYLCIETLKASQPPSGLPDEAIAWSAIMSEMLRDGNANLEDIRRILHGSNDTYAWAEKNIIAAWIRLQQGSAPRFVLQDDASTFTAKNDRGNSNVEEWRGKMRRITKHNDSRQALKLWLDFQESGQSLSVDDRSEILASLLWTFARVGLASRVHEIWQSFDKYGITPTTSHWRPMIETCRLSRDLNSLKGMWLMMQSQGVRPANQDWTALITALCWLRDKEGTMRAVRSMIRQWNTQEDSKTESSNPADFQPSMIPVNAAVTGLLQNMGNIKGADELLQSVREQGLAPTTDTFNILLHSSIRRRDTVRVQQLLRDMRSTECEPDVITFTIFIDGLVRNSDSSLLTETPEAQYEAVLKVFADMESLNLKANGHTYTTLMHSFLDPRKLNLPAAQATLKRMNDEGIELSTHIYCILVTHYFQQEPPNVDAVEALCRRAEGEVRTADRGFYDRVVEGYARLGDLEKMLAYLRKEAVRLPSWRTLLVVLRVLVAREEWEIANELVKKTDSERDPREMYGRAMIDLRKWREEVQALRDSGHIGKKNERSFVRKVSVEK